jgi:hypothetical protein
MEEHDGSAVVVTGVTSPDQPVPDRNVDLDSRHSTDDIQSAASPETPVEPVLGPHIGVRQFTAGRAGGVCRDRAVMVSSDGMRIHRIG